MAYSRRPNPWKNRLLAMMAALWAAVALATSAGATALNPHQLQLTWEVQRTLFTHDFPQGRSIATFTLKNGGAETLPAQGWALYFNSISGLDQKPVEGAVSIEHLGGTWYRLRPDAQSTDLLKGMQVQWSVLHPEVMVKAAKAPTGPYIVYDTAPQTGYAIRDYTIAPLTRPEQWDHGSADAAPLFSPQAQYERNAKTLDLPLASLPPVFPTPLSFERGTGTLKWNKMPLVQGDAALRQEIAYAKKLLRPYFQSASIDASAPALKLHIAPIKGQPSAEAYAMEVDPQQGVRLTGASTQAVARGLQSLRDLLTPAPAGGIALASMRITDAPRFTYRGFQLDVARNFQTKTAVFRLLDLMARYKLNKFHFHLTDDEGWRLEIPGLPELTSVGARRGHALDSLEHLPPAYGSGPNTDDAFGSGFYSGADYIEILRYAAARHIEVIPEIEMPGHARAAVKSMERRYHKLKQANHAHAGQYLLHDLNDASVYRSAQFYTDHVMNPGLPSTYAFIDKVVTGVAALHKKAGTPLQTIHVGADELPNGAWEKSPATRALMEREKFTDTTQVWDYFYLRVDNILKKKGLAGSGWEELGARKVKMRGVDKLIPNPVFTHHGFTLYVWNDLGDAQDLAYRMANAGYKTILAPATHLYFDMAHNQNPNERGVNWAAYTDLEKVFDFVPFNFVHNAGLDGLTDYGQKNILGLEGTLFSETVRSLETMDYLLMPRMLALAERAWAADPAWARETDKATAETLHTQAWSAFANQLGKVVLPRLNTEIPGVLYRIAPPGLKVIDGKVHANHQTPGVTLRYTTDGSEPQPQSPLLQGPLTERAIIKAAAFDSADRRGLSSRVDNR